MSRYDASGKLRQDFNANLADAANRSALLRHLRYKEMFGANLIAFYPLNDAAESSTAKDYSGNGYNGAYVGTPSVMATPFGDGESVPVLTGTHSINIFTSGLVSAINLAEGAVFFDAYATPAQWVDASTNRYLFMMYKDDNNRIYAVKDGSGTISFYYIAGGTNKSVSVYPQTSAARAISFSVPMRICFTWSVTANALAVYVDGVQWSTTTGLGTFVSTPDVLAIASLYATAGAAFHGEIANFGIVSRYVQSWEARRLMDAANYRKPVVTIIGDSIENDATDWPVKLLSHYNDGYAIIRSHAVTGNSIVTNMATQVAEALTDRPNIVIFALGTNDDNTGDMGALQTIVETQINLFKAVAPNAEFYYMNVLPRWTDVTGVTSVDKGNIRTAIAAACTATGITCWDTYGEGWITVYNTVDGTHPTSDGSDVVAIEINSKLGS